MANGGQDLRFDVPLYSMREASRYLQVAPSTFSRWAKGYVRPSDGHPPAAGSPVLSNVHGGPGVTFIALAEGMVLAAVRASKIPMQRIRPALLVLQEELGIDYALASRRLYTDGAELLYDVAESQHAEDRAATKHLVVIRNNQRVFTEVVERYLRRIEYGEDGYARLLYLPAYRRGRVVADPCRSFGQPVFAKGGAKVTDVIDRVHAGESLDEVSEDFGVPIGDLEDALRVASHRAA